MSQAGINNNSSGPFPPSIIWQWLDRTASFPASAGTGYFITNAEADLNVTVTLPAAPSQGDTLALYCDYEPNVPVDPMDDDNRVLVQTSGTQKILFGVNESSAGGIALANQEGCILFLVYRTLDTTWHVTSGEGNWSLQ